MLFLSYLFESDRADKTDEKVEKVEVSKTI